MKFGLTLFIGVAYIAFGIFVLINQSFGIQLEPQTAYALGAVLIIYGIFRIGRALYQRKRNEY